MGSEQQFCLRWHNYQSSLLATLPLLLDGDDLTDVTLCAGGRSLKAHRVVLSACSQYFKDLFKEMQPIQHPVIVLPGTEFTDLCALVTFMYSGEVNIYQHQLNSLLAMAETLHIRGLAEFTGNAVLGNNNNNNSNSNNNNNNNDPIRRDNPPRCKRTKLSSTLTGQDELLYQAISRNKPKNIKTKVESDLFPCWDPVGQNMAEDLSQRVTVSDEIMPRDPETSPPIAIENDQETTTSTNSTAVSDTPAIPTDLTQGSSTDIYLKTSSRAERNQNVSGSKLYATCVVCGKQLSNQYNLRVHMETHQNAQYSCSACNHVSRSRDALRKHVSYRHPPPTGDTPIRANKQLHP